MSSVICTLFENNYHYGLAGLINSVYKNGYRGQIYVGYKGELPFWASDAKDNLDFSCKNSVVLQVEENLKIYFLPIETTFHLANFKPYFLLQVMQYLKNKDTGIVYFDPDIVIKCQWKFFENWMKHGVAIVHEIISNDMPESHPIRQEWRLVIEKANRTTKRVINSYINSGFCGVSSSNVEFLKVWAEIIDVGIEHFNFGEDRFVTADDRNNIFLKKDQDALNIAAMCCESPISEMGPEGMDFIHGGFTMSHAVGCPKPWNKNFITSALNGIPPSQADKGYWLNVNEIILTYSALKLKRKLIAIKVASIIGRFYKRS